MPYRRRTARTSHRHDSRCSSDRRPRRARNLERRLLGRGVVTFPVLWSTWAWTARLIRPVHGRALDARSPTVDARTRRTRPRQRGQQQHRRQQRTNRSLRRKPQTQPRHRRGRNADTMTSPMGTFPAVPRRIDQECSSSRSVHQPPHLYRHCAHPSSDQPGGRLEATVSSDSGHVNTFRVVGSALRSVHLLWSVESVLEPVGRCASQATRRATVGAPTDTNRGAGLGAAESGRLCLEGSGGCGDRCPESEYGTAGSSRICVGCPRWCGQSGVDISMDQIIAVVIRPAASRDTPVDRSAPATCWSKPAIRPAAS